MRESGTDTARHEIVADEQRKDERLPGPRAIERDERNLAIARAIVAEIFGDVGARGFAVRYWTGHVDAPADAEDDVPFTLVLNGVGSLRRMLLPPSELRMAEAYVLGYVDIVGDVEAAAALGDRLRARLDAARIARVVGMLLQMPSGPERTPARDRAERDLGAARRARRHSRQRDRAAVSAHYDVGNDFYALFLDRELVYSCAYFPTGKEDIDAAQIAKLDHICRKLRLQPGERLLDVGCGWGALIRRAASRYGAYSHGITLSNEQAALARQRAVREGLGGRCTVDLVDYRALGGAEPYDKVVSVGMFEHVGRAQQEEYFARMYALTKPGGLFLNHGIVQHPRGERTLGDRIAARLWGEGDFIDQYVFPDGELVTLEEVIAAGEHAGFETRDVESLREHYALTLRHWVRRLEAAEPLATALVGAETYRVWRLYMSASAHGFASGRLNLTQVLFARPDDAGRVRLPRTRGDLCESR